VESNRRKLNPGGQANTSFLQALLRSCCCLRPFAEIDVDVARTYSSFSLDSVPCHPNFRSKSEQVNCHVPLWQGAYELAI